MTHGSIRFEDGQVTRLNLPGRHFLVYSPPSILGILPDSSRQHQTSARGRHLMSAFPQRRRQPRGVPTATQLATPWPLNMQPQIQESSHRTSLVLLVFPPRARGAQTSNLPEKRAKAKTELNTLRWTAIALRRLDLCLVDHVGDDLQEGGSDTNTLYLCMFACS